MFQGVAYGTDMRNSLKSSRGDNMESAGEITEPIFAWYMEYIFVIIWSIFTCSWLQKNDDFQTKG